MCRKTSNLNCINLLDVDTVEMMWCNFKNKLHFLKKDAILERKREGMRMKRQAR